jgi:DNA polymerase-3 subunit alpha (Gram-positive type)
MDPKIIFFDLETTGLNWYHDSIIEICGYDFDISNNNIIHKFNNLCIDKSKHTNVSERISKITGITNDMLVNAASEEKVLKRFIYFITNTTKPIYLIAHNCKNFDKLFLLSRCKYYSIRIPNRIKFIDTVHLAKMLYPKKYSFSLKNLCIDFNIQQTSAHRAEIDTIYLYYIFIKMYKDFIKINQDIDTSNYNLVLLTMVSKLNCNL